jgi:glycosyltransferase involved in cell wall biosynthesis
VLGAFPWSSAQGSQLYAREQARALARAGADPLLVTYGRGPLPAPDDLPWLPIAPALSPRGARSGPSAAKLLADAALAVHWIRVGRRGGFAAALAHNAEAAAAGIAARPATGVPVVYVAHTLLEWELPTYGAPSRRRALAALGRSADRQLARRADAVVVLCDDARVHLAPHASGPVVRIPPGHVVEPPPSAEPQRAACARAGVEPGRFALYAGNLDAYQGLAILPEVAARLRAHDIPLVVATHDASGGSADLRGLRVVQVEDVESSRALIHGAGVLLLPRRIPGGFPMKLLHYLESGRPVVAHPSGAPGLEDGVQVRLLPPDAPAERWADAVASLLGAPDEARALGAAGRRHLAAEHDWTRLAGDTLALVDAVRRRPSAARVVA